jgi:hypothetical protein
VSVWLLEVVESGVDEYSVFEVLEFRPLPSIKSVPSSGIVPDCDVELISSLRGRGGLETSDISIDSTAASRDFEAACRGRRASCLEPALRLGLCSYEYLDTI